MALIIPGYTYIQHKLKLRPWGPECQFTVARPDGTHINEVIAVPSTKIEEKELEGLISSALVRIDRVTEPIIIPRTYMEDEVKQLLVDKGFIKQTESVADLKPLADLVREAKPVEGVKN